MWPWEPQVEGSWKCSVALFTLIVELSDRAQPLIKLPSLEVQPIYIYRKPRETNLSKWCRFPRERFLTHTVFARSPLERKIKSLPLEIQQIIVTKVWQNRTVHTSDKVIRDFSNFIEKDYMLSQYLEHVLLTPQGKELIENANKSLKRIENVAMGIYTT
jgi:hypothetical protein